FIAAVIPTTRGSRSHSRTSASPKTWVYWGAGLAAPLPRIFEAGLARGRVPLLHALQAAVLGGGEALALDRGDVHHDRPFGRERLAQRLAQRAHVVAVHHAHVGPVELLPPQPGTPEVLDRLLQVGAEALEGRADPTGEAGEAALDARARVPQLGVEANAVEVARQRAHVGSDRHAVVVEHHHDRRAEPTRLADRLEGHPACHGAVPDHGHDL